MAAITQKCLPQTGQLLRSYQQQKCLPAWLHSDPEAEPVNKAYQALREQLLALCESGLCTGSTCKCNLFNSLAQQVCQAAAAALQAKLLLHTPSEDQQQQDSLQAQLQMQGIMPLADIWLSLPCMAARLLRGQHNPDAVCSLADVFNRWGGWIAWSGLRLPQPHGMQNQSCCWCC